MNELFQQETTPENFREKLVGPGRKFSDDESLARGKWESDNYIKTLEGQLDELRQDYLRLDHESKSRASIEELLNRRQEPGRQEPPVRPEPPVPKQPDPLELATLFDEMYDRKERAKRESDNIARTSEMLRERFGNDYQDKLQATITDMGLDTASVNALARRSPEAVQRLLGLEQRQEMFQSPPRPTSFDTLKRGEPKRTAAYYEKMKRERPEEYRSPRTNVMMHKDAQELGESFFDAGPVTNDKNYHKYIGSNAIFSKEEDILRYT